MLTEELAYQISFAVKHGFWFIFKVFFSVLLYERKLNFVLVHPVVIGGVRICYRM
jgi:hypothetical protein